MLKITSKYLANQAFKRALKIFQNKTNYQLLRKNCEEAVIDVDEVARNWNQEFYRMKNKFYTERNIIEQWEQQIN